MLRHVFSSSVAPLVVQMAIAVPEAILIEVALSFLGLGSQPLQFFNADSLVNTVATLRADAQHTPRCRAH